MRKTDKIESSAPRMTRRDVLKGGAFGAAGIASGILGFAAADAEAAVMPKEWHESYDVVIVGSGFAGLAAALEAKKAGSSVAILEKMRAPGGNSIINGGVVSAAGSPLEAAKGIEDSPDLLYKDMLTAGLYLNHPELARMVAEKSNETVQWTITELGVKYRDDLTHEGGHSVPRMYSTHNQSGSAIVLQLLAKLKEMGVQVRTRAFLTRLLRDEDGRVKGVEVRHGYVFPDDKSGQVKYIRASKAVVLATGGFGNDVTFRTIQDPRLTKEVDSTNQPGATSEALREALRIGCTPVQLSWIQLGPWGSPDEKGFGSGPIFAQLGCAMYGLWIDTQTGKRFVNELADRKIRADAILRVGNKCIAFADATGSAHVPADILSRCLESGVVKKYDSLDAIAAAYSIPVAPLKETVKRYDASLATGKDEEWGRYLQKDAKPVETPPFYVMRLMPKVHHCMGGVRINAKAQALDIRNDQLIPGLYAAGEATGGVHGAVRLGSCATLDCLIFGRIAGRNAAAEKPWGRPTVRTS